MTDTTTLFLRNGTEFTGAVYGGNKPYALVEQKCRRCGGQGESDAWRFTGRKCYDCRGTRVGTTAKEWLYTADRLAELNATAERRRATEAAKAAEAAAKMAAEAEANMTAFMADHGDALRWLETVAINEDGDVKEGFCGDMILAVRRWGRWTEKQSAAVYKLIEDAKARDAKRAGSEFIGKDGDRLTFDVTVEGVTRFYRPSFSRPGAEEAVYVTTMRDADGNAIVAMTPSWAGRETEVLTIAATVKEHKEYRGEKQTVVQRVKTKAVIKAAEERDAA